MEGRNVMIPCQFQYFNLWWINGTVYSLSGLPSQYNRVYPGIEVVADRTYNGTVFLCLSPAADAFEPILGIPVTLYVQPRGEP